VTAKVILDTGPLVAFLNRRDNYHGWATEQLAHLQPPLLTCEAVLSEACFLLRKCSNGPSQIIELLQRGLVTVPFRLDGETSAVKNLLKRYNNLSASLADACIVRMTELYSDAVVLTLDSDFHIYRKHGRQVIKTLIPEDR